MSNLTNLTGTYKVDGSYLIHIDHPVKLCVTTRTHTATKKPLKFLVDKTTPNGGYISSLYPTRDHTGGDSYNFDFKGYRYILTINKTTQTGRIKQQSA